MISFDKGIQVKRDSVFRCLWGIHSYLQSKVYSSQPELRTFDDEVFIEEPPPKRPSKQDLCHAIDVLQTFSLIVRVDHDYFKTNIKNISRIVDRDRFVEKRQGLLTDYFSKTE